MLALSQMKKASLFAATLLVASSLPFSAYAAPPALNSNAPTVALTATLGESLTLSTTVSAVSFTLASGTTVPGSAAVPITTNWVLNPSRTSVKLYGFFASSTAALTDGLATPDLIPSADVLGQVAAGPFTAFTQTAAGFGGASASLLLYTQAITSTFVGSRTDNLSLEIATPATLPAGTYTGTITLMAQAN